MIWPVEQSNEENMNPRRCHPAADLTMNKNTAQLLKMFIWFLNHPGPNYLLSR